jgi:hypothetical protein
MTEALIEEFNRREDARVEAAIALFSGPTVEPVDFAVLLEDPVIRADVFSNTIWAEEYGEEVALPGIFFIDEGDPELDRRLRLESMRAINRILFSEEG